MPRKRARTRNGPLWTHDCEHCVYLGSMRLKQSVNGEEQAVDYYFCGPSAQKKSYTLLRRFSNKPWDNVVCMEEQHHNTALYMALCNGLLSVQHEPGRDEIIDHYASSPEDRRRVCTQKSSVRIRRVDNENVYDYYYCASCHQRVSLELSVTTLCQDAHT